MVDRHALTTDNHPGEGSPTSALIHLHLHSCTRLLFCHLSPDI